MKRSIIKFLALIGVLAVFYSAVGMVYRFVADYEALAKSEFGDSAALKAVEQLYARVEASPLDVSLKEVYGRKALNGKVRLIPKNWLPERFSSWGRPADQIVSENEITLWADVVAYYDEKDALIGIEFNRSRYGCFASKDPMRCPPWYFSLQRIRSGPIYVAIRVTD